MNMQSTIEAKLRAALSPVHLEVENESHLHSGPRDAESHFKIIIVSDRFVGQSLIEQQRMVNGALASELSGAVHALSMKTLTPEKWQAAGGRVSHETPLCRGGSK